MAESEPQMSGASAPASQEDGHLPIQQPTDAKDAVELRDLGGKGRPETEEAPTLPPKDDEPAAGSAGRTDEAGDGTRSTKGKQKEENPPAPIEKTDPLAQDSSDAATAAPAITTATTTSPADGSVCNITLLLPTGARHPYRIDEKYLSKRSVDVPDLDESGKKDPFSISIYKLKELILREWRDEWDGKPASPSSIRLIHFGKLLEDKEQLKKYQFSADAPNVVHMSVRPAEMVEEDEQSKAKSSGRDGRPREGGSGCCVIL